MPGYAAGPSRSLRPMKHLLLLLSVLLAACPVNSTGDDDDDDATGDDDDSTGDDGCATVGSGELLICAREANFPTGQVVSGTFQTWGAGANLFQATGGSWTFDVTDPSGALAALPDLSALGTIALSWSGTCDSFVPEATFLAVAANDPTDVLLFTGNTASGTAPGWTVSTPRDIASCPVGVTPEEDDCCFCHDVCHPKTVTFDNGTATALAPDSTQVIGSHTAFVWESWSGEGVQCEDVSTEVQAWALARTNLLP